MELTWIGAKMGNYRLIIGLILVLMTPSLLLASQDPVSRHNFKITRSAISEDLTQQTVRQTFQDETGLIWILTQEGLHRFDGYELRTYQASEENVGSISHNNVRQMVQDTSGKLWIATTGGGLNYYDPGARGFKTLVSGGETNSLLSNNISTLISDEIGMLWLGYLDGRLSMFDPHTQDFVHRTVFNRLATKNGAITAIAAPNPLQLWVGTTKEGLLLYQRHTGAISSSSGIAGTINDIVRSQITTLHIAPDQTLWIGTSADGLFAVNLESGELKNYRPLSGDNSSILSKAVNTIYEDHENRIWIGTDAGLSLFNAEGTFTNFNSKNSNLEEDFIMNILQDQEGNFWIGTHYGLYAGFHSRFEIFNAHHGLESESITSFAETAGNTLWVGTYDTLYFQNRGKSTFEEAEDRFFTSEKSPPRIMSLEANGDNLWIGTRTNGVAQLDLKEKNIKHFRQDSSPSRKIGANAIVDIFLDDRNVLWVSTFGGGVTSIGPNDQNSLTLSYSDTDSDTISSNVVYKTLELSEKWLLFTTTKGISLLNRDTLKVRRMLTYSPKAAKDQPHIIIDAIQDDSGRVWLSLQNSGLLLIGEPDPNLKVWNVESVETYPKLPKTTIYSMQKDEEGMLWLSAASGLARLNPNDLTLKTFDYSDGLQDNEFNFGASFKDSKGRLYFGGNRGFNRFDPARVVEERPPPRFVLTNIDIAGKELPVDVAYANINRLDIGHEDYYINFEFSALDYTEPHKNRYRYKLENFDRDWIDLGARHNASFTNLPSGHYRLHLKGANSDGVWNEDGKALALRIFPAPWLTWWAFSIYFGFLFWLIWFSLRYYDTYMLKERANELADVMHGTAEQAMDDLEDQLDIQQLLIENVRDHTEQVMNVVSDLLDKQAEVIDDPTLLELFKDNIERFAALKYLDHHIYYLADRLEVNFHDLVEQLIAARFTSLYVNEASVAVSNSTSTAGLPAAIAVPCAIIVNELLSNSYKHAFQDGLGIHYVNIVMEENVDLKGWRLEVSDSGSGLPGNVDPAQPTTFGLEVVRQFTLAINAAMTIDRTNGTQFVFEIPRPAIDPKTMLVPR
ncbi:hypothetical protein EYC98_20565 [Halieaceae bacterium IMCC14734]|uniref:Histidine kinase/HSP90-like ATPase domain-containing protein n=1 Tax=Candidatus Litorirhabdus singularis TaxID=2518993 RepID=A0ABT3TLQ3_9GAMM|nr:two-component regulator propeller domain-containing protein [Candidatus Litorirhabdus singularis]MCX2983263.1 hypothetical protein [Candidatus Litorirhabdus singularis]